MLLASAPAGSRGGGAEPLALLLRRFKDSLGISDEDAAAVHMDIGRRINRLRSEVGSRKGAADVTRAFQKLIYVSTQVFGDKKSAFLLPWKRHFDLTDAQIFVAKRDFARQLFKDRLAGHEAGLPAEESLLAELRTFAEKILLPLEVATDVLREAAKKAVDTHLAAVGATACQRWVGWHRCEPSPLPHALLSLAAGHLGPQGARARAGPRPRGRGARVGPGLQPQAGPAGAAGGPFPCPPGR